MRYLDNRRKHHSGHGGDSTPTYSWVVDAGAITTTLANQSFTLNQTAEATYIDKDGVMQAAVDNVPRLGADGMYFEPAGGNILLQSRNFDFGGGWPGSGAGLNRTQDQTGVCGAANTAWSIEDDNASSKEYFYRALDISPDNSQYTFSIFVKKDSDETRFPEFALQFLNVSTTSLNVQLNTKTGATDVRIGGGIGSVVAVESVGDWWRLCLEVTDDSNNTEVRVFVYPAFAETIGAVDNSAVGTIIIDAAQLEYDKSYPSTYIDNDGVAIGAEELTNGDFSSTSLGAAITVAGITKANPGVVTFAAAHGLVDGQTVYFSNLDGMTELNTEYWILRSNAGDTFELETTVGNSLDTSGYVAAEVSGNGDAQLCTLDNWTVQTPGNWTPDTDGAGALTAKLRGTAAQGYITGSESMSTNTVYQFNMVIDSVTAGTVKFTEGATRSSAATYYEYLIYQSVRIDGVSAFTGVISSASVKEHGKTRVTESDILEYDVPSIFDGSDEGVVIVWLKMLSPESNVIERDHILELTGNDLLYFDSDEIVSKDGTNKADIATPIYSYGDYLKIAVMFPSSTNKFKVGYDDDGNGISWSPEGTFDGAYPNAGFLIYSGGNVYSAQIKRIEIWDDPTVDPDGRAAYNE